MLEAMNRWKGSELYEERELGMGLAISNEAEI